MFVWKDENKQKEAGVGPFFLKKEEVDAISMRLVQCTRSDTFESLPRPIYFFYEQHLR